MNKTLPRQESLEILSYYSGLQDLSNLAPLAEALGDLPAALSLAGSYLQKSGLSPAAYLRLFLDKQNEIIGQGVLSEEYPILVAADLSIKHLEKHDLESLSLLMLMGFYHPEDLPFWALQEGASYLPDSMAAHVRTPEALGASLKTLESYFLVQSQEGNLRISHPLVQAALRRQIPRSHQGGLAMFALLWLGMLFSEDGVEEEKAKRRVRLLPHLREAARHCDTLGCERPKIARTLLHAVRFLIKRNLPAEAKEIFLWAVPLLLSQGTEDASLGVQHLSSLEKLGEVLRQLEDKVGAKLVYEETLKLTEEIYGKGSSKTAPFSIQLGALLQEEGDIEGAIRYYEQAGKAAEGEDNLRAIDVTHRLAALFMERKDFVGARAQFERAIRLYEMEFGPDYPGHIGPLVMIAMMLLLQRQPEEAKPYYQRALKILRQKYDRDYFLLFPMLSDLCNLLQRTEQHQAAMEFCELMISFYEAEGKRDDPQLAPLLNRLAVILYVQGETEKIRPLLERALVISQKLPEDDIHRKAIKSNLEMLSRAEAEEDEEGDEAEDDEAEGEEGEEERE